MVCLSRPYSFKSFKGCLPQIVVVLEWKGEVSFGHVKIVACYRSYVLRVMFIWVYLVTCIKCQQVFRGKYLDWVEDPVTL